MSLVETQNVSFHYPAHSKFQLHPTSLSIQKGELVGLLGPNGAGKSTLLKLMVGLLLPGEGQVLFNGKPLRNLSFRARGKKMAYVPQATHFTFPLSVWEVVEMGRHPYLGRFQPMGREDRAICNKALGLCDALEFKDRAYDELSGGEKQRILLASALAQTPEILLLDEPTLSLDLSHQMLFFKIIQKLHREENLTVVVATHELNLAGRFLKRLILMKSGQVEADGVSRRILSSLNIKRVLNVDVEKIGRKGEFPYFVPKKGE